MGQIAAVFHVHQLLPSEKITALRRSIPEQTSLRLDEHVGTEVKESSVRSTTLLKVLETGPWQIPFHATLLIFGHDVAHSRRRMELLALLHHKCPQINLAWTKILDQRIHRLKLGSTVHGIKPSDIEAVCKQYGVLDQCKKPSKHLLQVGDREQLAADAGATVEMHDVDSLAPRRWLNISYISAALKHLRPVVYHVLIAESDAMQLENSDHYTKISQSRPFMQGLPDAIVVPILVEENHWIISHIVIPSRAIEICDPMQKKSIRLDAIKALIISPSILKSITKIHHTTSRHGQFWTKWNVCSRRLLATPSTAKSYASYSQSVACTTWPFPQAASHWCGANSYNSPRKHI
jgi:hypothetical protein